MGLLGLVKLCNETFSGLEKVSNVAPQTSVQICSLRDHVSTSHGPEEHHPTGVLTFASISVTMEWIMCDPV